MKFSQKIHKSLTIVLTILNNRTPLVHKTFLSDAYNKANLNFKSSNNTKVSSCFFPIPIPFASNLLQSALSKNTRDPYLFHSFYGLLLATLDRIPTAFYVRVLKVYLFSQALESHSGPVPILSRTVSMGFSFLNTISEGVWTVLIFVVS